MTTKKTVKIEVRFVPDETEEVVVRLNENDVVDLIMSAAENGSWLISDDLQALIDNNSDQWGGLRNGTLEVKFV